MMSAHLCLPSMSCSPASSIREWPPHWEQPFKKQGNIMQEHRKSEETGFWAGLAKSLCELQQASGLCSAGPKPAESLPRAAGRAVHLRSAASGVGSHPELCVPDERQINPSPSISTALAQFQGDSPTPRTVTHLCPMVRSPSSPTVSLHSVVFKPAPLKVSGSLTQFSLSLCLSVCLQSKDTGLAGVCQHSVNHPTSGPTLSTPDIVTYTPTHTHIYTCTYES